MSGLQPGREDLCGKFGSGILKVRSWRRRSTIMESTPVEPTRALQKFTLFPRLAQELRLLVWEEAVRAIPPGRIVKFDEVIRTKDFAMYNTCLDARQSMMKRYIVVKNPGILFSSSGVRGPPFVVFIDYNFDTILLMDLFGQHPIDRAITNYSDALAPVKKVAINLRSVPLQEFILRPGGSALFWQKLMAACPCLQKLFIIQNDGIRGHTPRTARPPQMIYGSLEHWAASMSYDVEKAAGRYPDVEIEYKEYVDDN